MALTDTNSHLPPTSGAQAYNSDIRPVLGGTYVDSVFGETVRRISDIGANSATDWTYGHCLGNSDATLIMHKSPTTSTGTDIKSAADGSELYSDVPLGGGQIGGDGIFHPSFTDRYIYPTGNTIAEYTLGVGTATLKNFGVSQTGYGQSQNWVSKDGDLYLYRNGANVGVWERSTNTTYTGVVPMGNWVGITPSGNHIHVGDNVHIAYAINRSTKVVDTTAINFWAASNGADHGVPVSGSDGVDYGILLNGLAANGESLVYAVTMIDRSGIAAADQPGSAGTLALMTTAVDIRFEGHLAHGPNGAQDYVFFACEASGPSGLGRDRFNDVPGVDNTWGAFKQEIIAINYLTNSVRRLCHYRSRYDATPLYYSYPRISCTWDGSLVIFDSNFNDSTPSEYGDLYTVTTGLGASGGGGALLTRLHTEGLFAGA